MDGSGARGRSASFFIAVEEGRRKKEEGRRKKEEGRRKKEEGRRKRAQLYLSE
ncbi:MAG: hypothetical protein ACRC62_06845 [Microcoleus sp.]